MTAAVHAAPPPPTVAERAKRRTANGPRAVHGKSEESWSGRAATAWSVCHLMQADRWQKIAAQPDRAFRNRIGRATPEGAIRPRRFATPGGGGEAGGGADADPLAGLAQGRCSGLGGSPEGLLATSWPVGARKRVLWKVGGTKPAETPKAMGCLYRKKAPGAYRNTILVCISYSRHRGV